MRYILILSTTFVINMMSCRQFNYDEDFGRASLESLSDAPYFETVIEKPEAIFSIPHHTLKFIQETKEKQLEGAKANKDDDADKMAGPSNMLPPPPIPLPLPPPEPIDDNFLDGFEEFNKDHNVGPGCGNGIKTGKEECDDGNDDDLDGCNNFCGLPTCGNSIRDKGEQCDDGNLVDGDGCSSRCQYEECGNKYLDPGEQCDDGNCINGDGCSNICQFEILVPPTSFLFQQLNDKLYI